MTKHQRKRSKVIPIAGVLFAVLFCVSAYMLITYYRNVNREAEAFQELSKLVRQTKTDITEETEAPSMPEVPAETEETIVEEKHILPVYAPLYAQNPDVFGWLRIEGTRLDYPVMYTPEDPEYYLHRAFDKTDSKSGVPFLDGSCYEGCGNYLIYGHHMKSGAMFTTIMSYADQAFWEEHPTMTFDTIYELGEYEVLAAFYAKIYPESSVDGFHYYQYTDLTDEAVFQDYLSQVKEAALYDTGVEAVYGDSLLTLSTCAYHTENGRFVVVARKISQE